MRGETGFLSFSTLKHLFMRGFWKVFCVCVYFLSSKSHRLHLYVLISHFLFLQYCTTASINDKELENILLGLADTAQPRLGLSWNWTWWIEMWLKHQGLQSLGLENWRLDYNTAIWYLIPVCVNGSQAERDSAKYTKVSALNVISFYFSTTIPWPNVCTLLPANTWIHLNMYWPDVGGRQPKDLPRYHLLWYQTYKDHPRSLPFSSQPCGHMAWDSSLVRCQAAVFCNAPIQWLRFMGFYKESLVCL